MGAKKKTGAKNTVGSPRAPFKISQEWVERQQYLLASKDDKIKIHIFPNVEGDYGVQLFCSSWPTVDAAKLVASLVLAVLLDEHGYTREEEDFEGEILEVLEELGNTPKITPIDSALIHLTEEQAKQLYERYDKGNGKKKKKGRQKR